MDSEQLQRIRSRTTLYDGTTFLDTKKDMAAYLEVALEDGDPGIISAVLSDIVRAYGMNNVGTGLSQDALAAALSEAKNPSLATFLKVVRDLDLELQVRATPPRKGTGLPRMTDQKYPDGR